ncbi:hypothetical protein HA075_06425 [bacterium BFN5]|nr:hypothetical protein HA075_06370 [bacterium BFN5]QJW48945.1 hypothetical protein HA075_06425 [bacterium BFN5]
MIKERSQQQTANIIAAVILPQHEVQEGNTFVVKAKDEEEQKRIMLDIAKAVKADVAKLSNGMYLILRD